MGTHTGVSDPTRLPVYCIQNKVRRSEGRFLKYNGDSPIPVPWLPLRPAKTFLISVIYDESQLESRAVVKVVGQDGEPMFVVPLQIWAQMVRLRRLRSMLQASPSQRPLHPGTVHVSHILTLWIG